MKIIRYSGNGDMLSKCFEQSCVEWISIDHVEDWEHPDFTPVERQSTPNYFLRSHDFLERKE